VLIRTATEDDWSVLFPIIESVVDAGETYVWKPTPASDQMQRIWLEPAPWHVVVAELDGVTVGTAKVGPNRPGRGAHVATASFIVSPSQQGRGVGRALAEYVVAWAAAAGYGGMQFNAVVETNHGAIALWKSLGFSVIGTVPEAFEHPTQGLVGLHIMYRPLTEQVQQRDSDTLPT
jgi:GNAT superfamily N-acetyltransferase